MLSLAALDYSKARIYGSLLVPTFSLGLAAAIVPSVFARPGPYVRRIWAAAGVACLAWVVGHGLEGYQFVAREAALVSPYSEVGRRLEEYLVPDADVLGSQRWWWALRDHDYRSLNGVWQRWIVERRAGHQPQFVEELAPGGAYLILDNDIRADLGRTPADLQEQVRRALANDADRVAAFEDRTYGIIELYRFTR